MVGPPAAARAPIGATSAPRLTADCDQLVAGASGVLSAVRIRKRAPDATIKRGIVHPRLILERECRPFQREENVAEVQLGNFPDTRRGVERLRRSRLFI